MPPRWRLYSEVIVQKTLFRSAFLAVISVAMLSASDNADDRNGREEKKADGRGNVSKTAPPGGKSSTTNNGINYHGGPVMTSGPTMYYIWYGNWTTDTAAETILTKLAQGIGGSPYFNINTTYYETSSGPNIPVTNSVVLGGQAYDNYSQGVNLSDAAVAKVVSNAISKGLKADPNGVYFVLTSADVNETSGFCTQYCGWHDWGTLSSGTLTVEPPNGSGGVNIKFAFIGNAARCPSRCSEFTTNPRKGQTAVLPPNGDLGADAMASIIAHELAEAASDPNLNAWYDRRGNESADKCAWTFGNVTFVPTKTPNADIAYNVTLGGMNFLIQQNWVNQSGGYCAMSITH
jgi:hypothetical protein